MFPCKKRKIETKEDEKPCKKTKINGLTYHPNVIDETKAKELIDYINHKDRVWKTAYGKRRVQQYGHEYDYAKRTLSKTTDIPDVLDKLMDQLVESKYLMTKPNQIIINEYKPGQGITPHTDHKTLFGEEISSLTLQSGAVMEFSDYKTKQEKFLEKNSLVCLTEDARWKWTHCIPARTYDIVDGQSKKRGTRLSITFRTIK